MLDLNIYTIITPQNVSSRKNKSITSITFHGINLSDKKIAWLKTRKLPISPKLSTIK